MKRNDIIGLDLYLSRNYTNHRLLRKPKKKTGQGKKYDILQVVA